MNPLLRRAAVAGAGATMLSLFAVPAHAAPVPNTHRHVSDRRLAADAGAVFVQNDDPAGNRVIAYERTRTGTLVRTGDYPTGGRGGVLGGSVVDHTASQAALTLDRRTGLLYAVNAGSDTVTVFAVHGDRLQRRQVIWSGGSFPVSVAVHGDLVYVLDARDGGAVQGFLSLGGWLVRIPQWRRGLGLDPGRTPEFTSTPGQVAVTPDGRHLVVTTKNGADTVEVFALGPWWLSSRPTVTSLPGTVPFAVAFDPAAHLILAEAGTDSVASFTVERDGGLTQLDSSATGQAATCWIVAVGRRLYLSNAGSATVSQYVVGRHGRLTARGTVRTDAGTIDAAASADGRYLYVQAGKAGIVDEYRITDDGTLMPIGAVTVPDAAGGEGIAAS